MYGKVILIILILLFLLYLWNNITESVSTDDTKKLIFNSGVNLYNPKIFFNMATILSKQKKDNLVLGNKEGFPSKIKMMDKIKFSENIHIQYSPDEDIEDPYFTYNNNEITINNVDYISGVLDTFPYYCGNGETELGDNYYTDDSQHSLFRNTRLAVLTKVDSDFNFPIKNIEDLIDDTIIIKLKYIKGSDNHFRVMVLDPDNSNLNSYLLDTTTIFMYIYEGLDLDDNFITIPTPPPAEAAEAPETTTEVTPYVTPYVYKSLMNIPCSKIMDLYGKRHSILMQALGVEGAKNPPTWLHNFLFDHIHKNIALEDSNRSNLIFDTLLGNIMYTTGDSERTSLFNNSLFKDNIKIMKYNLIFHHYQLQSFNSDNKILEYIALDVSDYNDIKNKSPDEIREMFSTLLSGNNQMNNNEINHQIDMGIDNIQNMIYTIRIGPETNVKTYVTFPYYFHMCNGDTSSIIGILNQLILELKDNKLYTLYTDVCRYTDNSQKAAGENTLPVNNYAKNINSVDKGDSVMLRTNIEQMPDS